jgi:hypothetical protein
VRIGVRPEDVEVVRQEREDGTRGIVAGSVSLPLIDATSLDIRVGEHEIHAQVPGHADFRAGDRVWVALGRYHVFDESGARLESHPEG